MLKDGRFRTSLGALILYQSLSLSGPAMAQSAYAEIASAEGTSHGRIDLIETSRGVLLRAQLYGLPAGPRGFHIHEVGRCEPPFQSAGGHFNPSGARHGFLSSAGGHAGDLPNLSVPEGGAVTVELILPGVTLKEGEPESLLDAEGTAFIIHSGADDYRSDPAGNAGGRIACGVIRQ
ncbi:MAG: superoxide dismutase family protein [Alphaproteobacteria bacterium]|nr:superoxide dismutase family protein [Alphaproteobacteria bacterium]